MGYLFGITAGSAFLAWAALTVWLLVEAARNRSAASSRFKLAGALALGTVLTYFVYAVGLQPLRQMDELYLLAKDVVLVLTLIGHAATTGALALGLRALRSGDAAAEPR